MKILVLGGSYFLGRVFVMQTGKEHDITVVNRGTYSMENFGARQITGDRRDKTLWRNCTENYDVLVDFCGYQKGDISTVLNNIEGNIKQYIFISTVDVYAHGGFHLNCENDFLEKRMISGDAGAYIKGKIDLEQELIVECSKRNIYYTILRPSILYGPFNYAPRESLYIQMLVQNHILPNIKDAAGKFQFVYVKDVAEAIIKCLLNAKAYSQIYNICDDMISDYTLFFEELKKASDGNFKEVFMTVHEAIAQNIPLPFPLTEAETVLCDNQKSKNELEMHYTKLSEGMVKTYQAFKRVFTH